MRGALGIDIFRHPKLNSPLDDRAYLDWIKEQSCIVCGLPADDPHHVYQVGKKGKRNDYLAIPLSRDCHSGLHQVGQDTFAALKQINYSRIITQMQVRYISERRQQQIDPASLCINLLSRLIREEM